MGQELGGPEGTAWLVMNEHVPAGGPAATPSSDLLLALDGGERGHCVVSLVLSVSAVVRPRSCPSVGSEGHSSSLIST